MVLHVSRSVETGGAPSFALGAFLTRRERPCPHISRWNNRVTGSSSLPFLLCTRQDATSVHTGLCPKTSWVHRELGLHSASRYFSPVSELRAGCLRNIFIPLSLCSHLGVLLRFSLRGQESRLEFEEHNVGST